MGEHMHMNQFVALSSPLKLKGLHKNLYGLISYLPRGIVGQPALQVSGVPAREQASALQVAQLLRGLGFRRDHLVEGVVECHRVIVSTLVLENTSWIQEQERNSALRFSVQSPMTQHSHPPVPLYVNLSTPCREPASFREAHPWAFYLPPWNISVAFTPSTAQKLPDTMNRLGQQGWWEQ